MKSPRILLFILSALVCGCILGWFSQPLFSDDPTVSMAEYGGSVDYGFNADITWHPETELKGANFSIYKTTWKWTFHNRSKKSIRFSIPKQKIHIDRSIYSSQFVDLPDSMLINSPIVIKPNEKRIFTAEAGGEGWSKAKDGEYGFRIIAKIDDTFHILGCAANIHKAPKLESQPNKP